jgi:hypothetical protein
MESSIAHTVATERNAVEGDVTYKPTRHHEGICNQPKRNDKDGTVKRTQQYEDAIELKKAILKLKKKDKTGLFYAPPINAPINIHTPNAPSPRA